MRPCTRVLSRIEVITGEVNSLHFINIRTQISHSFTLNGVVVGDVINNRDCVFRVVVATIL
jgi:hypothetical protein